WAARRGGAQRSLPTGGAAYGMPSKVRKPSWAAPRTRPPWVRTVVAAGGAGCVGGAAVQAVARAAVRAQPRVVRMRCGFIVSPFVRSAAAHAALCGDHGHRQ